MNLHRYTTRRIPLALILATSISAQAQQPTLRLSLQDATALALKYRYDLRIQQVDTRVSEAEVEEVRTRNLPQLNSDLDLRYNSQLQTNILPGGIFGPPGTPSKAIQFGTAYSTLADINLTENVYNPGNRGDRAIVQAQVQYQRANEQIAEEQVKLDVTTAYFTSLLWKEKTRLSGINLRYTQGVYETAQGQRKAGTITDYDLQHYSIDVANALAQDQENHHNLDLSLRDLLYKTGLDTVAEVTLTDSIAGLYDRYQPGPEADTLSLQRPELAQQQWQYTIEQLNLRKVNLSYFPTITLYGNYSAQYLGNSANYLSSNWYPFNYFGVRLTVPIWDGGLKSRTKAEYTLRSEAAELTLEKLRSDYTQEKRNALAEMANALSDLNYQRKNLDLAEDLYRIDSDRLRKGAIRPNDLATTYYTLQQTQTNYLNALYNYLTAVVQYKKSVGTL